MIEQRAHQYVEWQRLKEVVLQQAEKPAGNRAQQCQRKGVRQHASCREYECDAEKRNPCRQAGQDQHQCEDAQHPQSRGHGAASPVGRKASTIACSSATSASSTSAIRSRK